MLLCAKCKKTKPNNEFNEAKAYPKRGYRHVWCIPCYKEYHREYGIIWEKKNREKRNARFRTPEARKKRREWVKKSNYYEKNKQYWKDWYQNNKPTTRAKMDEWRSKNLDKWSGYARKRRAIMKGLQSEPYNGADIFLRDSGICGICGELINVMLKHPNPRSLSIDHIIPIALGGNDTLDNVQAAHLQCNASKAHRV